MNASQGAFISAAGVLFRVWVPEARHVQLVLEGPEREIDLSPEGSGFSSASVSEFGDGDRYRYRIDGGDLIADPASRFQPAGPSGPSQVVDTARFPWTDSDWPGVTMPGQVIYEMHVGTFTKEGTYAAAQELLPELKRLGITVIEMMPAADFEGSFGWGYDGVLIYAPYERYGSPCELASFINAAHQEGLAVILDVVYNHIGPKTNVLPRFSPYYFSKTERTDWGPAINFDGNHSAPVRAFFRDNAAYWIADFHFDGLRVDATQNIHDRSKPHFLAEMVTAARKAAEPRKIIIIGENEPQQVIYLRPQTENGYGFDALWNDDFHHSAIVALTGQSEAYYSDHRGKPQEFISALKYGYLFQGQFYTWQKQSRGTPSLAVPKWALVNFLQNHDQVANSLWGLRIHELTTPGRLRAMTAVLLLGPATPMLFQGQEYASPTPFLFFANQGEEIVEQVQRGRRDFLRQWRSMQDPDVEKWLSEPSDRATFERSKLDYSDRNVRQSYYHLHADLLALRREDPVISTQGRYGIDGAVLGAECFAIRFFGAGNSTARLLLVNLGVAMDLSPIPEPLLAAPNPAGWQILWSSENPKYGGSGVAQVIGENVWRIPGHAAVLLAGARAE